MCDQGGQSRGEMRLYKGDVQRQAIAEAVAQVVGRVPLHRRWGLRLVGE